MVKRKLLIVGAGGHAKVVIDVVQQNQSHEIIGLIDTVNQDRWGSALYGIEILGGEQELFSYSSNTHDVFIAIGTNQARQTIAANLTRKGFHIPSLIHPFTQISPTAKLGSGVLVMPGAIVNSDTVISDYCIINTSASVDHDCVAGEACHIAPGARVGGSCTIGARSWIGIGAAVRDHITIGNDCVVGAGAAVVHNIDSGLTVVGVPAKPIKRGQ